MIDDLIDYYTSLLIVQYHGKSTAQQEIALATKTFTGDDIIPQIIFDVDTSVGAQLDLIGKIVGLSRIAEGFEFNTVYYSYNDYSEPMHDASARGMSDIDNPVTAPFKDFEESRRSIYRMTDGQYRAMIKLKILGNNGIATNKYVCDSLYQLFGNGMRFTDNEDMTATLDIEPSLEFEGKLAEFLGLFPKPLGVQTIVNYL